MTTPSPTDAIRSLLDRQASRVAAGEHVGPLLETCWLIAEDDLAWLALAPEFNDARARIEELEALLNTPEIEDFDRAVPLEAAHQVVRWGRPHDDGKEPEAWFWLVGYLAGKALHALKSGDLEKAKHHCISTAAALRNWHAHIRSGSTIMRPGIADPTSTDLQL